MRHPYSLHSRRHNRATIMDRRRKQLLTLFYTYRSGEDDPKDNTFWHYCDKANLNCGSKLCHYRKYFKEKRKRRRALDAAVVDNIKSFDEVV